MGESLQLVELELKEALIGQNSPYHWSEQSHDFSRTAYFWCVWGGGGREGRSL